MIVNVNIAKGLPLEDIWRSCKLSLFPDQEDWRRSVPRPEYYCPILHEHPSTNVRIRHRFMNYLRAAVGEELCAFEQ